MIPRVAQSGRSFKGAALYYLHDKKANTSDRVAWSETVNLPTDDPDRAIAHMIDTATHADQLKQAAGLKSGRKLQKPVYVYSLAWHPDQAPTMADQMEAARETISVLGLSSHQALIVAHNDTDHPHVHVIVNRVDPETGKAAVMSNDQIALSKWAEGYERRHGQILCEARVQNNAERDKGNWQKHKAESRRERQEWKKAQTGKIWADFKETMKDIRQHRKPQYQALWDQRENRMATRKAEIKQLFKPHWRDLFKRQKHELANFDSGVIDRIGFALSRRDRSVTLGILEAMIAPSGLRREFLKKQESERVQLGHNQKQTIRDATREVHKAWQYDRDQLKNMHEERDNNRYEATREATGAIWKDRGGNVPANEQTASQDAENTPQRERVKRSRKRTRKKFADVVRETTPRAELERAQKEAREEAAKERMNERDTGRTRTPD